MKTKQISSLTLIVGLFSLSACEVKVEQLDDKIVITKTKVPGGGQVNPSWADNPILNCSLYGPHIPEAGIKVSIRSLYTSLETATPKTMELSPDMILPVSRQVTVESFDMLSESGNKILFSDGVTEQTTPKETVLNGNDLTLVLERESAEKKALLTLKDEAYQLSCEEYVPPTVVGPDADYSFCESSDGEYSLEIYKNIPPIYYDLIGCTEDGAKCIQPPVEVRTQVVVTAKNGDSFSDDVSTVDWGYTLIHESKSFRIKLSRELQINNHFMGTLTINGQERRLDCHNEGAIVEPLPVIGTPGYPVDSETSDSAPGSNESL